MPVIAPTDQIVITIDNLSNPPNVQLSTSRALPALDVAAILSSLVVQLLSQQITALKPAINPEVKH